MLNRNSVVVLIFSRIPCVLRNGNGLWEAFQWKKNTLCVTVMSDKRWGKLRKYKQRDRLRITQGGSFKHFVLKSWSTGTGWIGGCVDPTGSLEVWRRDFIHFTQRSQMNDNPSRSLVTGYLWLVTSDYAILTYSTILWWL